MSTITETIEPKRYAIVLAGHHAGKVLINDEIIPVIQLPVIPMYSIQDYKEGKPLEVVSQEVYVAITFMGRLFYIPESWMKGDTQLMIVNYIEQLIKDQAQ